MSRLPRSRWTRIGAWTGAALAWGTTVVMTQDGSASETEEEETPPQPILADSVAGTLLPDMPTRGLVILKYSPIPVPEQQVITKYVTQTVAVGGAPPAGGGGGGQTATSGSGAASSGAGGSGGGGGIALAPPPPPPSPSPAPAPAPISGGS